MGVGLAYKDWPMLASSWTCTFWMCHKYCLLSRWKPVTKYIIWQHCKVHGFYFFAHVFYCGTFRERLVTVFFPYFLFSNFFFIFLRLKNLFGNPKWTENKNCSQNSICEGNWKHAKCCFQFLIFKSQWKYVFNLMNLSHLMS